MQFQILLSQLRFSLTDFFVCSHLVYFLSFFFWNDLVWIDPPEATATDSLTH